MIVRRVGVWSVARLYGGMSAVFGLIAGLMFAAFATIGGLAGALNSNVGTKGAGLAVGGLSALFGVGAIVFMPIMYGVFGLIGGAIGAALYNLFAGLFGGIEVEIQP
jgi:Transmembrane domain of unknown function (DUF3566)